MNWNDINMNNSEASSAASFTQLDTEHALEHLDNYDNETQLELLKREIDHIIIHGVNPLDKWYNARFNNIFVYYTTIDWSAVATRFYDSDMYLHENSIIIIQLLDELLEERSTCEYFDLNSYYKLIHTIYSVWHHYKHRYCDEDDDAMTELIEETSVMKMN
jgi:hypothetical protein